MAKGSIISNDKKWFIRQNKSFMLAIVKVVDIFIIGLSLLFFPGKIYYPLSDEYFVLLVASILFFEFFSTLNNFYDSPSSVSFLHVAKKIINTWFGILLCFFITIICFTNFDSYQLKNLILWIFVTPFIILLWHFSVRLGLTFLSKLGGNSRTVAIAGATTLALDIVNLINKQPWLGYSFIGYFDDRESCKRNRSENVDVTGNFEDMVNRARCNEIDVIFITLPMCSQNRIKSILDDLSDTSAVVYFIPDIFVFDLLAAKVESFNGLPAVCVFDTPHGGIDGISKRLFDILFSLIILAVILIPMIIISIGIKLSSPGPILFKQRRYGFRGEEIYVWKFRTMKVCEDGDLVVQATQNDPRITKFGHFLRKTSLDELPQFINALQGRMSIVGPRPHAIAHNEFYRSQIKGYMLRHNVKPGITGLAQIRGFRGETDTLEKMEGRVRSDLEYIHNSSIMLDFEILIRTVLIGFIHENAY